MADIVYSTYDAGNVVIFDNFVYIKEGEVKHFPDRGRNNLDKEYNSVTFEYDDNNSKDGNIHKTWTAEEIAISNLKEHTGIVLNSVKNGEFIAPFSGILRVYCSYRNQDISITINDAYVTPWANYDRAKIETSIPFKLIKGDVVKFEWSFNTGDLTYFFLPYQYPYE